MHGRIVLVGPVPIGQGGVYNAGFYAVFPLEIEDVFDDFDAIRVKKWKAGFHAIREVALHPIGG